MFTYLQLLDPYMLEDIWCLCPTPCPKTKNLLSRNHSKMALWTKTGLVRKAVF